MGEAKTIAVIGGGASGLAAAVAAGEALRDLEGAAGAAGEVVEGDAGATRVVVYEASDRVGRSILATGQRALQLLERAARRGRLPQRRVRRACARGIRR